MNTELQEKIIKMINADLDFLALEKYPKDNIASIRCLQDYISGKLSLCCQCQLISLKQYSKLIERLWNVLDDVYSDKKRRKNE